MKITILGDGAWGTALALLLVNNGHEVVVWGPFPDYLAEMRQTRRNNRFLKQAVLPPALAFEADLAAAIAGAGILVQAAPSQYARSTLSRLSAAGYDPARQLIVNVAKGIEVETLARLSEVCTQALGTCAYAVLSGPSHAEEVCLGVPTAVVVAAADRQHALRVQDTFMNPVFRVYTSSDVVGVEVGGSVKNVFAVAAGMCDGMKLGDNTKAALLTRGIAEMARLGAAMGGRRETFAGLSGIGDMIVTCYSGHSRNRFVGEELGKGRSLDDITAGMGMVVAEGVKTARSAYDLAQRLGVETPIIAEVYAALYLGKSPRQALHDLMTRGARAEVDAGW